MLFRRSAGLFLHSRHGAILPVLAITLPVIMLVGMIAVNLASMQLTRTELKVATDAAARAGGRAWSEFQDVNTARRFAQQAAKLNDVGGKPLDLDSAQEIGQIEFGISRRIGDGRYVFSPATETELREGNLSGVRVNATHQSPLVFAVGDLEFLLASASSVASHVDRDIALVVDRSGSMAYFRNEDELYQTITDLHEDAANNISRSDYIDAVADYQPIPNLANLSLSQRRYSDAVLRVLTGDLLEYAQTINSNYRTRQGVPLHSRWALLEVANEAFFDFLEDSEQEEQVSITGFASSANVHSPLSDDLGAAEQSVLSLYPEGSTAIGEGLLQAVTTLEGASARPDAIKTIIVFTDGENKTGIPPASAGQQIRDQHPNLIIHTITFTEGADQESMRELAAIGGGVHYHANDGEELVDVFRTIAKGFRTIITQ